MKNENKLTPLSASRIKTYQSCTWLYYCKYVLHAPEKSNDGAKRGSICHTVFECLGNPRHKKHYTKIIKTKDVFSSKSVKALIEKNADRSEVSDEFNINLIKDMILNGLNYDFFGKRIATDSPKEKLSNPTESHDELRFDITVDEDDKKYRILGFIDKLFLYKKKKVALIRDFKTSKAVFSGKDIEDNLQDQFYSLAVSKLYPDFLKRKVEFLFLKFDLEKEGSVSMADLPPDELSGFEYILTELQKAIDSFSEINAKKDMASRKSFPSDGTFSGRLLCGFDEYEGQLKKDGSKRWGCPFKWAFEYYVIYDKDGKRKNAFRIEESHLMDYNDDDTIKIEKYKGCPSWNK